MTTRTRPFLLAALVTAASAPACSQTPVVNPLRSMERPKDLDVICLEAQPDGEHWRGVSLENCAVGRDGALADERFRLHSVVTQQSRGELAVVDLGRQPSDPATLTKADPRLPGFTFLPVGAAPVDVVADPGGGAVYVASGRDRRVDIIPSIFLRGPLDSRASAEGPNGLPWPRLEFSDDDGVPGALSIVREGDARRLYVTLPGARPLPKIAVFDLGTLGQPGPSAESPAKVGDITLSGSAPAPLPWAAPNCAPLAKKPDPWWLDLEASCVSDPTQRWQVPSGATAVVPPTEYHLAGVAVAGGKLFVADDRAPVIHVFDVSEGRGLEIAQIAVGSPTSRLAVSPPVPDEVGFHNLAAIDVCTANGWLGDGLDHSADSAVVAEQLGGRCRLHRYVYAVDLVNPTAGNGSLAVVDVPVLRAEGGERLDLAGATLEQPLLCDAPTFPARRIPLGGLGVGTNIATPVRSVVFVKSDPRPPNTAVDLEAVRCRSWNPGEAPSVDGVTVPDLANLAEVPADRRDPRVAAGALFRGDVNPGRMRGVFAWAVLTNGTVIAIDVDDYDATCRGSASEALFFTETKTSIGTTATGEYVTPVRRHHPRASRRLDAALVPRGTSAILSLYGAGLTNGDANDDERARPRMARVVANSAPRTDYETWFPSTESPWSLPSETWSVTYEGILPAFRARFGTLQGGEWVPTEVNADFCADGVETGDLLDLLDEVCPEGVSCDETQRTACNAKYGLPTDQPLRPERTFVLGAPTRDRLPVTGQYFPTASGVSVGPISTDLDACFGRGLRRYAVRAAGKWVVVGSTSGYLHRQVADPATKACVLDISRPTIVQGRAVEAPAGTVLERPLSKVTAAKCEHFVNPYIYFAVVRGAQPSVRDMRFTFAVNWALQPLALFFGPLPTTIRPIGATWDGVERLNWNMVGLVDADSQGLRIFSAIAPLSDAFYKSAF